MEFRLKHWRTPKTLKCPFNFISVMKTRWKAFLIPKYAYVRMKA